MFREVLFGGNQDKEINHFKGLEFWVLLQLATLAI